MVKYDRTLYHVRLITYDIRKNRSPKAFPKGREAIAERLRLLPFGRNDKYLTGYDITKLSFHNLEDFPQSFN